MVLQKGVTTQLHSVIDIVVRLLGEAFPVWGAVLRRDFLRVLNTGGGYRYLARAYGRSVGFCLPGRVWRITRLHIWRYRCLC